MDDFETLLTRQIKLRKSRILIRINLLQNDLKSIEQRVNDDGVLNDLGELQGSTLTLDVEIVTLATQQNLLKEYKKTKCECKCKEK